MSDPTTSPTNATAGSAGLDRLKPGELQAQVLEVLTRVPVLSWKVNDVVDVLKRSSGAIRNALDALVRDGAAEQTRSSPASYRATEAGVRRAKPATAGSATRPTAGGETPARSTPKANGGSTSIAEAPRAPTGVRRLSQPIVRPNGQKYHPRTLAGIPDVEALRKLRAADIPVLLYGPPGTGKTSVVEAAFTDVITVPGDGDTTVADLVGEYTQTPDGKYVFVDGPLVVAMREGRALLIDDATLIPPSVLAVLYPAMDGRRQITVKANSGEVVEARTGFYPIAGHNPGVHGAILTDALSSRFSAQIQVSTDYDLARELGINEKAVRVAKNLAIRKERGELGWVPQLRELIAFARIESVLGIEVAVANLAGVAPEDDRAIVVDVLKNSFGFPVTPLALGKRFL